jgi:hypothetical protein
VTDGEEVGCSTLCSIPDSTMAYAEKTMTNMAMTSSKAMYGLAIAFPFKILFAPIMIPSLLKRQIQVRNNVYASADKNPRITASAYSRKTGRKRGGD